MTSFEGSFKVVALEDRSNVLSKGLLTRATSSNVCASRTLKAGGGGCLIFDLTPELSVTLRNI